MSRIFHAFLAAFAIALLVASANAAARDGVGVPADQTPGIDISVNVNIGGASHRYSDIRNLPCVGQNFYGKWAFGGGCNFYKCWYPGGGCGFYGCWYAGGRCTFDGCLNEAPKTERACR